MNEIVSGITMRFSEEGEFLIIYPEGIIDATGIFPSGSERLVMEAFAGTTAGKTLLMRLHGREIRDPLTGLVRRDPGRQTIYERLERISSVPFDGSVSVLTLDLDHFGRINKEHGQTVGDQVLVWFTGILKRWVRGSDVVSRWGGEEFVIFTHTGYQPKGRENYRDRDGATPAYQKTGQTNEALDAVVNNGNHLANRIILNVEAAPCMIGGISISQRVTIGVATQMIRPGIMYHGVFEKLFEAADLKLRTAKSTDQRGTAHCAPVFTEP